MTAAPLSEELAVTLRVVHALERLGVRYLVGGSLASSLHGNPRTTNDADIVAELDESHVDALVTDLAADFYVSDVAVREALRRGSSFNAIHLDTMFKVDVFVMTADPLQVIEMGRRQRHAVGPGAADVLYFASAEDTVIQKLLWYRRGGEISDKQWSDIAGVIRTQGERLDVDYLQRWASSAGVAELLARSLAQIRETG